MRKELIVCDCCGKKIESPNTLSWEMRPSHVEIKCPRDGINGGVWSMDVCRECRCLLHEKIDTTVYNLRYPDVAEEVGAFPGRDSSLAAGLRTLRDKMGLNEDWSECGLMDMAQWVETMEAYRQQIIDIRAAMNLPPDHAAWQADLPALVKAAHLQWAEAVCELRGIKLQIRMDDAAFKVYDETLSQLTEARSIIETSLGLEYRDGGYFPLDDCNHDDEVEAMEALRKEHEVGRQ